MYGYDSVCKARHASATSLLFAGLFHPHIISCMNFCKVVSCASVMCGRKAKGKANTPSNHLKEYLFLAGCSFFQHTRHFVTTGTRHVTRYVSKQNQNETGIVCEPWPHDSHSITNSSGGWWDGDDVGGGGRRVGEGTEVSVVRNGVKLVVEGVVSTAWRKLTFNLYVDLNKNKENAL